MKGKRKNIQYFFIYIIMLAASAFLIFGGVKQLMMTQDLKASIKQKKEELEKTKQNLTNPDYVEYIARGKYLVTKEGEQVFKFPSKDD